MKKTLFIALAAIFLISCKQETKTEVVEIAKNSNWATSHLKGMVKSITETPYTADSTGAISAIDSCCIEIDNFDERGFSTNYIDKDRDGNIKETVFTRENDRLKFAATTENGKQIWTRTINYNEDGTLLNGIDTDTTGNMKYFYTEMTENDLGQALQGKMYSADSTYLGIWSREYSDGLVTGTGWVDSTGVQLNKSTSELNENGFVAKKTTVKVGDDGSETTVETYQYEYDDMGNWTKKTTLNSDGKVTKVATRVYTYYEKEEEKKN